MGQNELIDRVETLGEALGALLHVYREDIKEIFFARIALDSFPTIWGRHQIVERGQVWMELSYNVHLVAQQAFEGMLFGPMDDFVLAKHLDIIATLAKEFSEALRDAIKELETEGEL